MKIRVGNPDIPGNQAIRPDLDLLVCHDQSAVEQREIADSATTVLADGKRTARITGDVFTNNYGA
jgi:hypothetical protein